MKGFLATALKKNNKKLFLSLLPLFLIMVVLSVLSWGKPLTTTLQLVDSTPRIDTTYAYKATITPNVLHPKGGTVEAGKTLFKKITTAIPFDLKTSINADQEVIAKGTYNVQMILIADELWTRVFPLQAKQDFELQGTDLTVIDKAYKINVNQLNSFITQVEEETGVRQSQYDIEVVPTIEGEIHYSNLKKDIYVQDKLVFHYLNDEIKLASEKSFTTTVPFNDSETITNTFDIMGQSFPLTSMRIICTTLSVLLLLSIILSYRYLNTNRVKPVKTESDKINMKYGSRMISISQLIDFTGKTVVPFDTFKSLLKIADEKEQPIFFHEDSSRRSQLYIIVDGPYVYTFEPQTTETPALPNKDTGNDKAYVVS